ncbi:beta-arrestin-1-like [Babylonia areolata]|uniref:beta-arrestin-1-like n=1 Tax=Babylonia areolata TaxID=304850 RepID=UPI003FCEFB71
MATNSQTRVYTKSSANGKITVYLGKQDFVDHISHIDPVEGVVEVDSSSLQGCKVFAHVLVAFRYGRGDLDVMGLQCRKDLFRSCQQVFPKTDQKPLTPFQERVTRAVGSNSCPFLFELPRNLADTVRIQPPMGESDKQCGVDYELKVYVANNEDDKPQSGSSVRVAIRKLTFSTEEEASQPRDVVVRNFILGSGNIRLEASLDKERYYHGEQIAINTIIDNNSSKVVKKMKFSVVQQNSLHLHDDTTTYIVISEKECSEGFPIEHNVTGVNKVFHITPSLADCRHKSGVAVDGNVMYQDTGLASSTVLTKDSELDTAGIVVAYLVKVRLILGFGKKDLSLELPFTLTHPKMPEPSSVQRTGAVVFEEFSRRRVAGCEGGKAED